MRGIKTVLLMLAASGAILISCEPKPQPIQFGSEECTHCRMMITEPEFASQIVSMQGRAFSFDSIECMAAYDLQTADHEQIHSYWVPDFTNSSEWINALEAHYLHSDVISSPMGLYLSAFSSEVTAGEHREEYGGDLLRWSDVRILVRREWFTEGSSDNRVSSRQDDEYYNIVSDQLSHKRNSHGCNSHKRPDHNSDAVGDVNNSDSGDLGQNRKGSNRGG